MRCLRALALGALMLLGGLHLARGGEASPIAWVAGRSISAEELARRLAVVPRYQLVLSGSTPFEQRRAHVEHVVAPELRLDLEAARLNLASQPELQERLRGVLGDALLAELERDAAARVTPQDLERRFAEHQARYAAPRRIRIFRLLLADEEQAKRLIAETTGPRALERWTEQARKISLDKTTAMRRGDLGMVRPDGRTDVPTVRVDPALYAAAEAVRDGEVVPTPVREGDRFAVVWRRGSLPPREDSLRELEPTLRRMIVREHLGRAVAELLSELRGRHLERFEPGLIDAVPAPSVTQLRPFVAPPAPSHASPSAPAPSITDRGLR